MAKTITHILYDDGTKLFVSGRFVKAVERMIKVYDSINDPSLKFKLIINSAGKEVDATLELEC